MTTLNTPPRSMRDNCYIINVRTRPATAAANFSAPPTGQTSSPSAALRRTSISLHREHADALAEYLGSYAGLVRVLKYVAPRIEHSVGDNFSLLVWAEVNARKAQYRAALENS